MLKKITFISIATLFFAFLLLPQPSSAISITPAIREISLTQGETKSAILELENDGLEAVQLTTEVVNFTTKGETGEPEYLTDATLTGIATWVETETGPIVLEPGQIREVAVNFVTPANAKAGGHYVGILFNITDPTNGTDDNQVTIESKVGIPILATVTGTYAEDGKISTFTLNDTSYTAGPVKFTLKFQNTGDVHLKPSGKVTVTNMFGKEVFSTAVNSDLGAVLPDSVRNYPVSSWKEIGNGFGKYTAEVTLTAGTVTDSMTVSFWVFSTVGIVIAVVVVVVIIFLIVLLVKKMGKKPETTEQQQ